MSLKITKSSIYTHTLKNLHITLKFDELNTFWNKYPTSLADTIASLVGSATSLYDVTNALSVIHPLGLNTLTVIDQNSGSGLEIVYADVDVTERMQQIAKLKKVK